MPLAMAASIGPQTNVEPAIVATLSPGYARANFSATCAGGKSAPEIMAAIVSRMWGLAFSIPSSGSDRPPASLMYVLSRPMIASDEDKEGEAAWAASCRVVAAADPAKGDARDITARLPHFKRLLRLRLVCCS